MLFVGESVSFFVPLLLSSVLVALLVSGAPLSCTLTVVTSGLVSPLCDTVDVDVSSVELIVSPSVLDVEFAGDERTPVKGNVICKNFHW